MAFDFLQVAQDLIAAETVSPRGTGAAVAVLAPLYTRLGLQVQVDEGPTSSPEARQQNLLARLPGGEGQGLLLVTHLDTVDPGPRKLWATDPFTLTQVGDKLHGLGSADVKVDAACKLLAMERLVASGAKLARPLAFLGTFEEEVGCKGARQFADKPLFPARWVLCGEPSELRLIDAHKGYLVVQLHLRDLQPRAATGRARQVQVQGRAAHSSTPHLGDNAILKDWAGVRQATRVRAGSVANKVPADLDATVLDPSGDLEASGFVLDDAMVLAGQLWEAFQQAAQQSAPPPNPRFNPPGCVVNWGVLASDGADLRLTFDGRLLPGQLPQAVLGPFLDAVQRLSSARFAIDVQVDRENEAMQLGRPSALLDAAQETSRALGLDPEPQAKPTNTEAGVFARAGFEAMVFGPGVSTNNAHCANEHTLLSQCLKAVDFYEALARRLCLQH